MHRNFLYRKYKTLFEFFNILTEFEIVMCQLIFIQILVLGIFHFYPPFSEKTRKSVFFNYL